MIYLFSGNKIKARVLACEAFVGETSEKEKLEVFVYSRDSFDMPQIESLFSGQSLFFSRCMVVFKDIISEDKKKEDNEESGKKSDFLFSNLDKMAESENLFVFSEEKLNKKELDTFKKNRAEINSFEEPKGNKEKFNTFAMADALASKNKLSLWMLFRQGLEKGVSLDEMAGVMFWKIKTMLLQREFSKFKEQELNSLSSRTVKVLPEARGKSEDSDVAFEKFLLEIF